MSGGTGIGDPQLINNLCDQIPPGKESLLTVVVLESTTHTMGFATVFLFGDVLTKFAKNHHQRVAKGQKCHHSSIRKYAITDINAVFFDTLIRGVISAQYHGISKLEVFVTNSDFRFSLANPGVIPHRYRRLYMRYRSVTAGMDVTVQYRTAGEMGAFYNLTHRLLHDPRRQVSPLDDEILYTTRLRRNDKWETQKQSRSYDFEKDLYDTQNWRYVQMVEDLDLD